MTLYNILVTLMTWALLSVVVGLAIGKVMSFCARSHGVVRTNEETKLREAA